MGDLIVLKERLADRSRAHENASPAFFFHVCCPFSYLASERIERDLGEVEWIPSAVIAPHTWTYRADTRAEAERRAAALRLPLVWPDRIPSEVPSAMRAAAQAAEVGAGARFALAAGRLAFCGGFDLDDPEILAEAAAAAGIPLDDCIGAAGDPERDKSLLATASGLRAKGVVSLPAIRIGPRWFGGERHLAEAAALMRAPASYGRPLAPVG